MDYTKELKHVSLCAGYGGIDLGLARALGAVRTVAFVEIEAFAALNLVKKIEAGHLDECPIFTDLKAFPWELYRGRVDILSGGFPCQPFSSAGRRAGDSDPRHLWPYIANGIRRLGHPPIIFLENVEGIISSKLTGSEWADPEGTPVLLHVLRELERLGYETTAGVFSASEVGAPHQRKRVFIMGRRADLSEAGRGIVERLLRGTERGRDVAHTCDNGGRCPRASVHSSGEAVDRGGEGISTERDAQDIDAQYAGDAWPAPRGTEQHPWEPQRVTMGDTNSRDKGSRFSDSSLSSETIKKGQTSELSGSNLDRYEQRSELGNAPSKGLEGSAGESVQGREPRSACASVDNTDSEGRLRDHDEQPSRGSDRRKDAHGYNASTDPPSGRVQGQAEPTLGGDSDGLAGGMVYAELCHAVDNRTDELRLLGNGVVPATAEQAFRVLWEDVRAR